MIVLLKRAFPFLAMVPMVRLCARVLGNGPYIASHKEEQMVGLLKKAFPFLAMVPMVRLCARVLGNGPSIANHKEEQMVGLLKKAFPFPPWCLWSDSVHEYSVMAPL